ncbi:molecular chaperone DnaK, partial [Micromonospora sediminimaris]
LGGSDIEKIKSAHERLAQVSQEAGSLLYAQQAEQSQAGGEAGPGAAGGADATGGAQAGGARPGADDVVDAEIVDEDKK